MLRGQRAVWVAVVAGSLWLVLAGDPAATDDCQSECPCESAAEVDDSSRDVASRDVASRDADSDEHDTDDGCPLGCTDCQCCSGSVASLTPPGPWFSQSVPLSWHPPVLEGQAERGVRGQVFRPPKRATA